MQQSIPLFSWMNWVIRQFCNTWKLNLWDERLAARFLACLNGSQVHRASFTIIMVVFNWCVSLSNMNTSWVPWELITTSHPQSLSPYFQLWFPAFALHNYLQQTSGEQKHLFFCSAEEGDCYGANTQVPFPWCWWLSPLTAVCLSCTRWGGELTHTTNALLHCL